MLNRNHGSLCLTFTIFVLQHKYNLEIALHALGHAILHMHRVDIVIEQEHFKQSSLQWPTFATAKLTFSRQNLLSHGKTYFSTAKLT